MDRNRNGRLGDKDIGEGLFPCSVDAMVFLSGGSTIGLGHKRMVYIERKVREGDSQEMASSTMSGGGSRFWMLEGVAG